MDLDNAIAGDAPAPAGVTAAQQYVAANSAPSENSNQGRAFLAMGGGMIWPGVGHFIVGSFNLGLFWFTAGLFIVIGIFSVLLHPQWIPCLLVLLPLGVLVHLVQLVDAARCGRRSPSGLLGEPALRFVVGAGLLMLAFAWQHRAIVYLQDNVFELCYTPTPSMSPTLMAGDRFMTLKGLPIHRWDVVGVTAPPGRLEVEFGNLCKRVVGMPGEKVEITANALLINDKPIALPAGVGPYFAVDWGDQRLSGRSPSVAAVGCWGNPITLGPDEYFVLGDNSGESLDGRFWPSVEGHQVGATPRDQIVSTVVAIYWPSERWRLFPQP